MSSFRSLVWAALSCAGGLGAAPVAFRTAEVPWAALGVEYRAWIETQVDGRCLLGDVVLAVTDGVLPDGLRLQGDGIGGVARQMGIFRFRIRAVNNCGAAERDFQLQVTGKPVLRIAPGELVFEYKIGDPSPEPKNVLVSSTWPELPYSVTGAPNWIRITQRAGVTPFLGSGFTGDLVTVEIKPQDIKPGTYPATLVFVTRQGGLPTTVPVKLKVFGPPVAAAQIAK